MEQTIQIADKPTLDEIQKLLENSGYGLPALKTMLGNSSYGLPALKLLLSNSDYGLSALKTLIDSKGGGGGRYKPVNALAISGTQTLSFYGKGKLRFFTNLDNYAALNMIAITSLNIDDKPNHLANVAATLSLSTKEIEFDSKCIITLSCGGKFVFIYQYEYVTS